MILEKVPSVVAVLAEMVNMTPIAWKISSTSITIVFEQGPKMIFNRDQVLDAVEPVIHSMEDAMKFVKAADGKLLPKRKPRK
jgi:2C-methyl-D-erythritol 2,4-cyclodiphosphate synthase